MRRYKDSVWWIRLWKHWYWTPCRGCTKAWLWRNGVLRKLGVERCRACIARRLRRVAIDVLAYRLRPQLSAGVSGRRADQFWVWFDHLTHKMSNLWEINECPYCLHYLDTQGWKGRFSNWDEVRGMRPLELDYPGLWWHLNEWFNLPYRQRFAPCRHCGKWLTKRYCTNEYGGVCRSCRHTYLHP
jgi:hypothetical protein